MPPKQVVIIDAPTSAEFEALEKRVLASESAITATNNALARLADTVSSLVERVATLETDPAPLPAPQPERIYFTPASVKFISPVLRGTVLGTVFVEPESWSGQIEVSGADIDLFGIDNEHRLIAAQDLKDARDYEVIVTAL